MVAFLLVESGASTGGSAAPIDPGQALGAPAERLQPGAARVPLTDDVSPFELATIGGVLATAFVLAGAGTAIFGQPSPSLGPPAAGSFDRVWADRLHLDDGMGGRFLGRVPDVAGGYVLPFLPAVLYGIDAVAFARSGAPALTADRNADHRFVAYAEALGWTLLVSNVTKYVVGRQRPYVVLGHPELAGPAREANLSFFSSHSSTTFAMASFVSLDAGRRLRAGPLADATPLQRWLLGTAAPCGVLFGAASLVALSRVIDQQHWPTDVLAGAVVGMAVGTVTYEMHFDERGSPRLRHGGTADAGSSLHLVPTGQGIALTGVWQ